MSWFHHLVAYATASFVSPALSTDKDKLATAVTPQVKAIEATSRASFQQSVHNVIAASMVIIEQIAGTLKNGSSVHH